MRGDDSADEPQNEGLDLSWGGGFTISRVDKDGNDVDLPDVVLQHPEQEQHDIDDDGEDTGDPGFEVELPPDEEDEYELDDGEEEEQELPPIHYGRKKRIGCLGGLLFALLVVCVSAVIACTVWLAATDVLALGKPDKEITMTVSEDYFYEEERDVKNDDGEVVGSEKVKLADMDKITDVLYSNGVIKYKKLFKLFCRFSSAAEKVSAGTYIINTDYDYRAIINGMTARGGTKVEVDITIPEGYTLAQIFALLDANDVCSEEDMWEAASGGGFEYAFIDDSTVGQKNRLEGYLFPDTYRFYIGDSPKRVLNKMLQNFSSKWTAEYTEQADALGYSVNEIMSIAAMIEKESAGPDESPTIASVMYNRLQNPSVGTNGYLQMDSTVYYAIAGTGEEFSTSYDSPYNTYMYPGITPGPICNPGVDSIKAALWPKDTNYFYFALGKDGVHHFFKNYDAFIAFVNSSEYASSGSSSSGG